MKKLLFVLGSLLMVSTAMAEGAVEICGEKVETVSVHGLDSTSPDNLEKTVARATKAGQSVKICAVGALPVAILLEADIYSGKISKRAKLFVPEMD